MGFSCRADAWGGKKKDVSGVTWLVRVVAAVVLLSLLPAACLPHDSNLTPLESAAFAIVIHSFNSHY